MNQLHLGTVAASKAACVVAAARERTVVDFGLRRMQGADAGIKVARAAHVAGVDATSNVLAGWMYGIRVSGAPELPSGGGQGWVFFWLPYAIVSAPVRDPAEPFDFQARVRDDRVPRVGSPDSEVVRRAPTS